MSALLAIADVVPPRRLFCTGGLAAAAVNMCLLIPSLPFGAACFLRLATGVAMSFVYPPGMKAAATWFKRDRGLALGAMVGALCVGSALPNLIIDVPWQVIIIATSSAACLGALAVLYSKTHRTRSLLVPLAPKPPCTSRLPRAHVLDPH